MLKKHCKPNATVGVLAGAMAGLAASWLMVRFQETWSALTKPPEPKGKKKPRPGEEPTTVKVAQAISRRLTGSEIPADKREIAGNLVHYAFGTSIGAIYGLAAEYGPADYGWGLPYGASVWLGADNAALPLLGLAKPPTEYPLSIHAYALASHLVYGFSLDVTRRILRRTLLP